MMQGYTIKFFGIPAYLTTGVVGLGVCPKGGEQICALDEFY
jgi:hypothetical protein